MPKPLFCLLRATMAAELIPTGYAVGKGKGGAQAGGTIGKGGGKETASAQSAPRDADGNSSGPFHQFGMVKDLFTDSPINDHCQYEDSDAESHLSTYTEQLTKPEGC